MQSLLFRRPKSQFQSVDLIFSLFILSPISLVKPIADDHFLHRNHKCTLTKRNRTGCSTEYNTDCSRAYSVCQWATPAASERLTCMGRACYLHQFWKRAEVTSESYRGEFSPRVRSRTGYLLEREVSWASAILWHAYGFPHSYLSSLWSWTVAMWC